MVRAAKRDPYMQKRGNGPRGYNQMASRPCWRNSLVGASISSEERGGVVAVGQTLRLSDTLEVLNDSEWSPTLDPILLVHKVCHLAGKRVSLILVALRAAVEVLAGEFRDPDVLAKGLVPVLEILLEVIA